MSNMQLWEKYIKTRDKEAKDQIILSYIDLVKIIAGRLFSSYGNHFEYEDLVSYGIFGLLDAIEKYDPGKNVKFETYAYIRVRGAIIDQLRSLDWVPRSIRQKYKKLEDTYRDLEYKLGRNATDEEVALKLGVTLEELNSMLGEVHSFSLVSLDEKFSNNSNFSIVDEDISNEPQLCFEQEEMRQIVIDSVNHLPEREKNIITLYYYSELTYKEISEILGISESRISQLHTKAIMKLKQRLDKIS